MCIFLSAYRMCTVAVNKITREIGGKLRNAVSQESIKHAIDNIFLL